MKNKLKSFILICLTFVLFSCRSFEISNSKSEERSASNSKYTEIDDAKDVIDLFNMYSPNSSDTLIIFIPASSIKSLSVVHGFGVFNFKHKSFYPVRKSLLQLLFRRIENLNIGKETHENLPYSNYDFSKIIIKYGDELSVIRYTDEEYEDNFTLKFIELYLRVISECINPHDLSTIRLY